MSHRLEHRSTIDGATGYRDADGSRPPNAWHRRADGVIYGAAVVSGGRGYQFMLDGHVDRAMFDAFLGNGQVRRSSPTLPTERSRRPSTGYSIGYPSAWTVTPATEPWTAG